MSYSEVKYAVVCGELQVAFVLSSSHIVCLEPILADGVQFCSAASSAQSGECELPGLPSTLLSSLTLLTFPFHERRVG